MRFSLEVLAALGFLVGCGSSAGGTSTSVSFGDADSPPHPRPDATLSSDGATSSPIDGSPSPDASGSEVACATSCASACTGSCLAGRCYETVVSGARIVNNVSTFDATSLYWFDLGPDGGHDGYEIWSANKLTGGPSLLASSMTIPAYPMLALEPVAGIALPGTFFTAQSGDHPVDVPVFTASASGARIVYTPDGGDVTGLSVNAAGLLATAFNPDARSVAVLRLSLDGGAPIKLYSVDGLTVSANFSPVTSSGASVAWVVDPPDAQAQILAGSVDGGAPMATVAELGSINLIGFFLMDAQYVYWSPANTSSGIQTIYRAPLHGGATEVFLTTDHISSAAVDASYFYWTEGRSTSTWAVRRTSTASVGAVRSLLACVGSSVAVDDHYIFLTDDHTIKRAPK